MWPNEFISFRNKTCENYKIFGSSGNEPESSACSQIHKLDQSSEPDIHAPSHLPDSQTDHESERQCHSVTIQPSVHESVSLNGDDGGRHVQVSVNSVKSHAKQPKSKVKSKQNIESKSNKSSKSISNSKSNAKQPKPDMSNTKPAKSSTDATLPAKICAPTQPMSIPVPDDVMPARRPLPPMPEGVITQEEGIAYCKLLCDLYPEVFDTTTKGCFKGVSAVLTLKEGGLDAIKKSGPRPSNKVPYGLEDQFFTKLKKLYENLEPIDGQKLITASQLVPVIENVNGERKLRRIAINYKSTINQHLEDVPDIFTTCNDELAKCAGE